MTKSKRDVEGARNGRSTYTVNPVKRTKSENVSDYGKHLPLWEQSEYSYNSSSEKHSYLIENPRPRGEVKERAEHFLFLNYLPLSVSDELN